MKINSEKLYDFINNLATDECDYDSWKRLFNWLNEEDK